MKLGNSRFKWQLLHPPTWSDNRISEKLRVTKFHWLFLYYPNWDIYSITDIEHSLFIDIANYYININIREYIYTYFFIPMNAYMHILFIKQNTDYSEEHIVERLLLSFG